MFDIDKFYLMRKEFNVARNSFKKIRKELQKAHPNMKYDDILDFMKKAINPKTRYEAFKENPELGKSYRKCATSITLPENGKKARNNTTINMTLAVLTHETSAAKILNPGGFEPQKKMGYLVSAYKMGLGTWEELSKLNTNQLKAKCMTNKNLAYMDVNTQFYAQNNAAGSILGMFAVQKIAHAVLENNHLAVDVNAALNIDSKFEFKFAGHTFHGYTEFDSTLNSNGEYIGKVLGSLVASAADAVKDPVLNLMNINSTTANVLTTMIRMGIPFETACLLTSQQVITDAITEFNVEAVKGNFNTLSDIINKKLNDIKTASDFTNGDQISREEFTLKELQEGLAPNKNTGVISKEIQYKGLLAFQRFLTLSGELKGPTYTTRFNSISNAVGPHVIDNLIMEHKMDNFSKNIYVNKGGKYENIGPDYIYDNHPILKQFSRTVAIARNLFKKDIPILNSEFESCLASLDANILEKMYYDKKLFSKYADAFVSYCMLSSRCINENDNENLKYFITEFPKKFINSEERKSLLDNRFIQAIRLEFEKTSNRYVLKINTTGMDTLEKEKLSSGWADLYNTNPKLATDLFKYCFYRGGIGFNPKTFMNLLPIEVKQKLNKYIDTFRTIQSVNPKIFNDQFIRNNWNNNKVVPKIDIDLSNIQADALGVRMLYEGNAEKVKDFNYVKIKGTDKKDHLFMVSYDNSTNSAMLLETSPLGNNGEFFEMSLNEINKSLQTPATAESVEEDTSTPNTPLSEMSNNMRTSINMTTKEKLDYLSRIYMHMSTEKRAIFSSKPVNEKEAIKEQMNKWFKSKGIVSNDEEFNKVYKMFCGS